MGYAVSCPACGATANVSGWRGNSCPDCGQRIEPVREGNETAADALRAGDVIISPNPHRQKCLLPLDRTENYPDEWGTEIKSEVRYRDGRRCQFCRVPETAHAILTGKKLHVHHVNGEKKDCDRGNLIALCAFCHGRIEKSLYR